MTDITAEVVGPVDRPPVPTETPEVWIGATWCWIISRHGSTDGHWMFVVGTSQWDSVEEAKRCCRTADILIRIPASGGGK